MKTIHLHGILGEKFGQLFELDVQSAKEASHAIACQIPEYRLFMLQAEQNGMRFSVITREKTITEEDFHYGIQSDIIHIVPRIRGAGGNSGWFQTIAGAVMVGVGIVGFGLSAGTTSALIGSGIGMMVGGLATLFMPTPEMDNQEEDGNKPNKGFGGPVTTTAQGSPVPVLYGERLIGGAVINAAILTEDEQ